MDRLHRNRQHEGDLEQPLLQGAEKKEGASDSAAQNGHARSEISEAAGSEAEAAAAPSSRAQSVWRDPVVPATLAAVLCLWVLKLVQQGYVDGADTPLLILVCMLALKPFTTAAPPLQTSASMPVLPSGTVAMLWPGSLFSLLCALPISSITCRGTSILCCCCRLASVHRAHLRLEGLTERRAAGSVGHSIHPNILSCGLHQPARVRQAADISGCHSDCAGRSALYTGRPQEDGCCLLWRRRHALPRELPFLCSAGSFQNSFALQLV